MADKLTFLQIGLGSMGKRRVRNLFANGEQNVVGLDFSAERRKEAEEKYGIKTFDNLNKIQVENIDAVSISTPPDKHGDYIRWALANKKHFFVELATTDDGYEEIRRLADKNSGIVMAPSCSFRFFLPIKMVKKFVDSGRIGKVLAFHHHAGQYLPEWHPWEDYRQIYFAKKETGAFRTMFLFELSWLNWLFGHQANVVFGFTDKISDLELEMGAKDITWAYLKYQNKILGSLLIDVISRKPFRTLRVLGSDGVLEWEWLENVIKIYDAKTKLTDNIDVPKGNSATGYLTAEDMYNDEMKAFVDAIYGRAPYPYTFEEDLRNLRTLYKLEE
ncbi:MAG: Gfo/Idh/MocA family oxidoreductase [Candidatus Giovannonibacteria bacterium]|nr:MAG: Gfo/Idh/MocA family oxidoreductase [Candidatus Giovannonibacteria bacterium]